MAPALHESAFKGWTSLEKVLISAPIKEIPKTCFMLCFRRTQDYIHGDWRILWEFKTIECESNTARGDVEFNI